MKALFDSPAPVARVIGSPMGGGWIMPLNDLGCAVLRRFYGGEDAAPLAPLGGKAGYIVEPNQAEDLAAYLQEAGHGWEIG